MSVEKESYSYAPDPKSLPVYMEYENMILPGEFPTSVPTKCDAKSMKYSELYSVPTSVQYPELFTNPSQYEEPFFPVDIPDVIPNPTPAADFKQQALLESKQQAASNNSDSFGNGSGMEYLFSDNDLDLSSLLAMPAPANQEAEMSFSNDPFNLLGFQPTLEGLDLFDPSVLDTAMPDGIHYWNGLEKEGSRQAITDPVIDHSYEVLPEQNKCEEDTALLPESNQQMSPINSELSFESEDCSMSSAKSPTVPESWEKGLRDLFEKTFDMSDIEDDYMLPPPNKRQDCQERGLEKKPQLPSPPLVENTNTPPKVSRNTSPQSTSMKNKSKSSKQKPTLMFGKHEGEIIHKLLLANDNTHRKPITRDKLITIPVEEFNQLLDEAKLSEIEVAFMKEWRRRGKNKAAAQVARKRKREEVCGLDEEVEKMRQQKVELEKRCGQLQSLIKSFRERSKAAEDKLFQNQSQRLMETVSRDTHLIHVVDNDKLLLIPRISSKILVVNS